MRCCSVCCPGKAHLEIHTCQFSSMCCAMVEEVSVLFINFVKALSCFHEDKEHSNMCFFCCACNQRETRCTVCCISVFCAGSGSGHENGSEDDEESRPIGHARTTMSDAPPAQQQHKIESRRLYQTWHLKNETYTKKNLFNASKEKWFTILWCRC